MTDEQLDIVLASIAEHLVVADLADARTPPTRRPPRHRRLLAVAALVAVVVAGATTIAPARHALADIAEWMGFGATRIERVEPALADPTGLLPIAAGLPPVSAIDAEHALGRPLPTTANLQIGEPDMIATPPEGGALLVWNHQATTLWILPNTDPATVRTRKLLDEHDEVAAVPGLGEAAVSIDGDHILATPHRRIAANSVLLWFHDGLEYRLESNASPHMMLTTARTITPR